MDITAATANSAATGMTTTTTTTTTTTIGAIIQPSKSPEAESETPPRIQPSKPMPFTNGVLKRHKHKHNHHHHHHHTSKLVVTMTYKECLKNHAACLGGHALDGCGEFMPAPTATATDPTSLKCAACGCHRNFHRREVEDQMGNGGTTTAANTTHVIEYHPHHRHHPLPPPGAHLSAPPQAVAPCRVRSPGSDNNSPPPISSTYYPGSAPQMLLALSSGGGIPDDNTKQNPNPNNHNTHNNGTTEYHHHQIFGTSPHMPHSRKRFRTKFSQEQKDRMYELAQKVGWKMHKSNQDLVNKCCNEIGVERGVFKVWMHNNKNTLGKRSVSAALNYEISDVNQGGGISIENINDPIDEDEDEEDDDDDDDENGGMINGNGVIVGNSHSSSSINDSHHHQQYNNGPSVESNAVPTNGSTCSS